mmetsp:Transcript_32376/g.96858  ORF Transcript_32376/g.96858 Transcript_32376/m.96858 type:complete len:229 (+) Transcript_32376:468-1154(+)
MVRGREAASGWASLTRLQARLGLSSEELKAIVLRLPQLLGESYEATVAPPLEAPGEAAPLRPAATAARHQAAAAARARLRRGGCAEARRAGCAERRRVRRRASDVAAREAGRAAQGRRGGARERGSRAPHDRQCADGPESSSGGTMGGPRRSGAWMMAEEEEEEEPPLSPQAEAEPPQARRRRTTRPLEASPSSRLHSSWPPCMPTHLETLRRRRGESCAPFGATSNQ